MKNVAAKLLGTAVRPLANAGHGNRTGLAKKKKKNLTAKLLGTAVRPLATPVMATRPADNIGENLYSPLPDGGYGCVA